MATAQAPHVQRFLSEVVPNSLVEGATSYGELHPDLPDAPLLGPEGEMGWAFVTSDFVGTTGYSGKPIHVMVIDDSIVRSGLQVAQRLGLGGLSTPH